MARSELSADEKNTIALSYANSRFQVYCSKNEIGNDGTIMPKQFAECQIFMHFYDLMIAYLESPQT